MNSKVLISKKAAKQIKKLPHHIIFKLYIWVDSIEELGIQETRKSKGFHDEPLIGKRKGQRSIRLNNSYRAIYIEKENDYTLIEVLEVNNHDY